MGMYADVCGVQVKLSGLISGCLVKLAEHNPLAFQGADVRDGLIYGSVVVLSYDDATALFWQMRQEFLSGQASKYMSWSQEKRPLTSGQDILSFHKDVNTFTYLSQWLFEHGEGDELVFA